MSTRTIWLFMYLLTWPWRRLRYGRLTFGEWCCLMYWGATGNRRKAERRRKE